MMGILNRVLQEGFDLAGVRLLYPTTDLVQMGDRNNVPDTTTQDQMQAQLNMLNNIGRCYRFSDNSEIILFGAHWA